MDAYAEQAREIVRNAGIDTTPSRVFGHEVVGTHSEWACVYGVLADQRLELDTECFALELLSSIENLRSALEDCTENSNAESWELVAIGAGGMKEIIELANYLQLSFDEHALWAGRKNIEAGRSAHIHRRADWKMQVQAYHEAMANGARNKIEAKLTAATKCGCSVRSIERALRRTASE
ncbi:MAG: hypothetical protein FKY71_19370 [Spiribacter salinus]|uniref:Uncharacterized protein n=1 Tax=Spiribacter salinus TaxID=1335746 RepID=A0A540V7L1_9GAMM|nr:MAG: hypothetical protein FKY71_19370 [Spiribacter salinus]